MPAHLQDHPKGAPGSAKAKKNGCICPVIDNRHGYGMYVDTDEVAVYAVHGDCPVHMNGKDTLAITGG